MVYRQKRALSRLLGFGLALVTGVMTACTTTESRNASDPWYWYRDGEGVVVRQDEAPHPPAVPANGHETRQQRTPGTWPQARPGDLRWTWMAFPTGDPATSAVGLQKGLPAQVRLGQPFEYELWVTNLTQMTLSNVVVSDVMGEGFKFNSSTPAGRPGAGGEMTWNVGDLAPREEKVIRITGVAERVGVVSSCAMVTYNAFLCAEIPVVSPELAITKAGPAQVVACDVIEYRIEVANTGTGTIRNVEIRDPLPNGMTTMEGANVATFNVPVLEAGQRVPFTARVRVAGPGRFENRAMARAEGLEAQSEVVRTVVTKPVLAIDRTCRESQFIGLPLEAEITVRNTGDGVAANLVVTDMMPPNSTFVSATDGGTLQGNRVVWNLGNMPPNANKRVGVRYAPQGAGTFAGMARAEAVCAEAVQDGCQTVVTGVPALLLEVVDSPDPIQVGQQTTYTITVVNQGTTADTNIQIVATLEDTQEYVSSNGPTRATVTGRRIEFAPIPTLAPGARAQFQVVVRGVGEGDTRFRTTMTSDFLTRPVEETESTNIYELR